MLARTVATLDHMLKGRLTLQRSRPISPGEVMNRAARFLYKRSQVGKIRRGRATEINIVVEVYKFANVPTASATPYKLAARCCISAAIPRSTRTV
jgi:alkanesulfonate monooxygenase